jgi:tripartite-type tricarboxylate transporter receptor subunit TctC
VGGSRPCRRYNEWPTSIRKHIPMTTIVRAVALLTALLAASAVHGQVGGYPNRPVKVIVPFPPGGPSDVIARLLAQKFSENLGQQFYIENRAGGGGNLGTALAARAPADGYTILVASSSFMINPGLYAKIPYDPYNDFDPVTEIADTPNVLVVHPSLPAKTVGELVALVRASPGKLSYANPGTGTPSHLSGEMFKLALKIDMVAVPFQGGGPMIQSVVGGHTPIAFSSMPPAAPQIKEGRIRALAVTSAKRSIAVPEVPTMAEAGVGDQEGGTPQGILVPKGAPKEVGDLLYRETVRVIALPEIRQKLAAIGFEPIGSTPAEFSDRIRTEIPKWAKVIRDANIKPE